MPGTGSVARGSSAQPPPLYHPVVSPRCLTPVAPLRAKHAHARTRAHTCGGPHSTSVPHPRREPTPNPPPAPLPIPPPAPLPIPPPAPLPIPLPPPLSCVSPGALVPPPYERFPTLLPTLLAIVASETSEPGRRCAFT
jgi:hypothetical protein